VPVLGGEAAAQPVGFVIVMTVPRLLNLAAASRCSVGVVGAS
jgi:hypothetical protein